MAEKEILSREELRARILEALRAEGIDVARVGILVLVDSLRNTANWDLASIEPSDPTRAETSKIIHRVCREMQSRYDVNTA